MHLSIFHHPACEIIVENKGKTDLNHTTEEQEKSVFPIPAPVLLMEFIFFVLYSWKLPNKPNFWYNFLSEQFIITFHVSHI